MKFKHILAAFLFGTAMVPLIMPSSISAQDRINPARTSDLSDEDWTAWRVGVLTAEEADKALMRGDYANAVALYEKTLTYFRALQKKRPHWNQKGLQSRIQTIERSLSGIRQKYNVRTGGSSAQVGNAQANANAMATISE